MNSDSLVGDNEPVSISSSCSAHSSSSYFEKHSCETLWEIANFSSTVTKNGPDLSSCSFSPKDNSSYQWFIGLRITEDLDQDFLEVYVKPDFHHPDGCCHFNYTLSIENINLHQLAKWNVESTVFSNEECTIHRIELLCIQNGLVNDELLIRVDINFQLVPDIKGDSFRRCISLGSSDKLLGDLFPMLGSESFSDVVILVPDEGIQHSIPAHQVILAARSPVLRAKLTGDTAESRDRCIRIDDLDIATVRSMLAYIYTDKFDNGISTDQAIKLLKCSVKYSIPGLKSLSELHLVRAVNNDNVFDCLVASDIYNAKDLKAKSLEIISQSQRNITRIKEALTSTFGDLTQEQKLNLLTEIIIEVSSKFLSH